MDQYRLPDMGNGKSVPSALLVLLVKLNIRYIAVSKHLCISLSSDIWHLGWVLSFLMRNGISFKPYGCWYIMYCSFWCLLEIYELWDHYMQIPIIDTFYYEEGGSMWICLCWRFQTKGLVVAVWKECWTQTLLPLIRYCMAGNQSCEMKNTCLCLHWRFSGPNTSN